MNLVNEKGSDEKYNKEIVIKFVFIFCFKVKLVDNLLIFKKQLAMPGVTCNYLFKYNKTKEKIKNFVQNFKKLCRNC